MFNEVSRIIIIFTAIILIWTYCNAGAMRCRDMGIKGSYFVAIWLSTIIIGQILIVLLGSDCDSPGPRFIVAIHSMTVLPLVIIPGKQKNIEPKI